MKNVPEDAPARRETSAECASTFSIGTIVIANVRLGIFRYVEHFYTQKCCESKSHEKCINSASPTACTKLVEASLLVVF